MPDINWGGDAAGAPFTSRLDDESENLILAETDTGTALFEWDGGAWQFRGPVEMNGEDVSEVGSLTATSGNFDSVNTEDLKNSDVSKGSTKRIHTALEPTDNAGTEILTQPTDAVGTTATSILDLISATVDPVALVIIRGNDGDTNRFYDLVQCSRNGQNADVINSQTSNSPVGRTYGINSEDQTLTLAVDSGTYDVVASAMLSRRDI